MFFSPKLQECITALQHCRREVKMHEGELGSESVSELHSIWLPPKILKGPSGRLSHFFFPEQFWLWGFITWLCTSHTLFNQPAKTRWCQRVINLYEYTSKYMIGHLKYHMQVRREGNWPESAPIGLLYPHNADIIK